MSATQIVSNPFALMMNPELVLAAMADSERLASLTRRVCKPLDKPLVARVGETAAFDELVDAVDELDD